MSTEEPLLEKVRREREASDRAQAEQSQKEREQLGLVGYRIEIGGDPSGGCNPVRITNPKGEGSAAWICRERMPRRRCDFCQNWSVAQCDYPTGGPCKKCKGKKLYRGSSCHSCAGTGYQMCNKRICASCRAHRDPDEDYCPDHRVYAGFPALIKREQCHWTTKAAEVVRRDCLHQGCGAVIEYGGRVLYFPRRKRAMCEGCGERYLAIAQ